MTRPITDTDIRYYGSCLYSVYSVVRNNTSVDDHVTALSYQSSSLGLALIT